MPQKVPEMGLSNKKWNTHFGNLWFSMDKPLTCRNGSTTCSLRYALLSSASAGYSLDVPHDNASIHTLWQWNRWLQLVIYKYESYVIKVDWSVALFAADCQAYNTFRSYVEETTSGMPYKVLIDWIKNVKNKQVFMCTYVGIEADMWLIVAVSSNNRLCLPITYEESYSSCCFSILIVWSCLELSVVQCSITYWWERW